MKISLPRIKRARLGKQHKREVIQFELHLSENLWALHYDLKYKKYEISGYNRFMIQKNGKFKQSVIGIE